MSLRKVIGTPFNIKEKTITYFLWDPPGPFGFWSFQPKNKNDHIFLVDD